MSNIDTDFLQEWLLEACMGTWKTVPLNFLDNCFELNVCGHKKTLLEVALALQILVMKGWIWVEGVDIAQTNSVIDAICDDPIPPMPKYGLTADGMREWESRAKPDWNRYVNFTSLDDDIIQTEAGSVLAGVAALEEFASDARREIDWSSLNVIEIVGWQPFPQKQLPRGFELRVVSKPMATQTESEEYEEREEYERPISDLWFRKGFTRL